MRKVFNFIMCLLFVSATFAQDTKQPIMHYQYAHQLFLDKIEVNQNIICTTIHDSMSTDIFKFKVDTVYYFGKYEPYSIKKNKFYTTKFNIIADNTFGDTLFINSIQCKDSFVLAIPIKFTDNGTHLFVHVLTIETKERGIWPFRKVKSKTIKDRVCNVVFSNEIDSRYSVRLNYCNLPGELYYPIKTDVLKT